METYGLLGYPLGHSFSRGFFSDKFAKEGIDAEYLNFELPTMDMYLETLDNHPTLRGHNVTIPYKQQVIPFLDEMSDEARAIGAVNVVKVSYDADGKRHLKGFNSDVIGFVDSIRPLLKPHHTHALILGTGGASRAIYYGLTQKLGISTRFVSRTKRPLSSIINTADDTPTLTYDELTEDIMKEHTVIVNCSPVGMHPKVDACPAIPYECLSAQHLLYDLVYNPLETLFMKKGMEHGATVKNGLEMLHLQAIASWHFWNSSL